MAWISFIFCLSFAIAQEPPRFYTKHASESLRYISMDGRVTYVQKKPGVMGLVSNFRSVDFMAESSSTDFLVTGSFNKIRLVIEAIINSHSEYNLFKNNKLSVVGYGDTKPKEIGLGRAPRLHLRDEWISYYDGYEGNLHIQNVITSKKYTIKLSKKSNPFFVPEVVMPSSEIVTYTDINEQGFAAYVSYNLSSKKSTVIYKAAQTGTRLELCRNENYLSLGEFPYDGVSRVSTIRTTRIGAVTNLAGFETVYSSQDQDLGNMLCLPESVWFIKTTQKNLQLTTKTTDAVAVDLKTKKVEIKSKLGTITQIMEMDGRVLVPYRGEFFVLQGTSNLGTDTLKIPSKDEELPIEI